MITYDKKYFFLSRTRVLSGKVGDYLSKVIKIPIDIGETLGLNSAFIYHL